MIDVLRTEDARVEGVVTREGGELPVRFSGWLELMHVLEPAAVDDRRCRHEAEPRDSLRRETTDD